MTFVPLMTSIVSLVFAVLVLDQFFAHRRPYQFVWSIGLLMCAEVPAPNSPPARGRLR